MGASSGERSAPTRSAGERRPSSKQSGALRALALPWLVANGPATVSDLAWWAGAALREARDALAVMGARPVTVKDIEGEVYATEELLDELARTPAADGGSICCRVGTRT